jgi:hypothetical protein
MKKVIRLTESELIEIFRNVIREDKYKISKDDRVVISDTPNFKQIVPLTQVAACKYGGGTKWCVSGEKDNKYQFYKDMSWDVSMVMIKNPEIQELFKTKKFAFNIYEGHIELHNDLNQPFYLKKLSEEAGVYDEVKSLLDDYINFMVSERGLEKVKTTPLS